MSIEQHPTKAGYYYVKSYPNGRNKPPHRDLVDSYAMAVELDAATKKRKTPVRSTSPRLQDVAHEYMAWCRSNLAAQTCRSKFRRLDYYIMPFFGSYRVEEIDQRLLDKYSVQHKKWMYATDHNHLFAMIAWMIKRGYAKVLTWKPERVNGNHAVKPVPHPTDILRAIGSIKKEKYRILFTLCLLTGLRWNEARNILWEDIDLTYGSIRLKEVADGPQDIVYIPDSMMDWFKSNYGAGWVFESDREGGKPVRNLWYVLEQASKVCGVHLSTHTFRHASATYLYEQSGDIYQVQAHLRHKKVTTSQIYARMSISKKRNAIGSIEDYCAKNS